MKKKLKEPKLMFFLLTIFLAGLALRIYSIFPENIIIGFDQARDLFLSKTIWTDFDIKIIGPTAGNNLNLHHGVLWLYFILPPIIVFGGNPFWVAAWNSLVNVSSVFVLYLFAKSLFESKRSGMVAAVLAAVSFYYISYSGWLSNPSPTLVTVPLFFYGVWEYFKTKKWGLVLAAIGLAMSIQFELFFIYLIPIFFIVWLFLRFKFPDVKTLTISVVSFCLVSSTMILTEIKYQFSGVFSILGAGEGVQKYSDITFLKVYVERFLETFSQTIFPINEMVGIVLAGLCLAFLFLLAWREKTNKAYVFLIIYLFSSGIMLLLGYHAAPWFLIGLPPAIIVSVSLLLSKINNNFLLISVLIFITCVNVLKINISKESSHMLLEPDRAAIMGEQLKAVEYTYVSSSGEDFSVNTLTNPLYVNAVWAWHYKWYGQEKYGYLPTFSGGEQLYPYNTLPNFEEKNLKEKYLYLIFDQSPRIPEVHRILMKEWAEKRTTLLEEKKFNGIYVQKREFSLKN